MNTKGPPASPDAGFDPDAWHDRAVWGLEWRTGSGGAGDWTSDLEVRFDSIVEVRREDDVGHYRVAPAKLVFRDVTDLRIDIDTGRFGHRRILQLPMIHTIEREETGDRHPTPYYRWRIRFEMEPTGEINFGASGFTEMLLGKPFDLVDRWFLTFEERTGLL
jgi:hypothetical protein